MIVREYTSQDLPEIIRIWNEVVEDGIAFPQEETLDSKTGAEFFASQSYTGVAKEDGKIFGLYIIHPNNVGRCGHICNASYAVSKDARGRHIGEQFVTDCLKKGKNWVCQCQGTLTVVRSSSKNAMGKSGVPYVSSSFPVSSVLSVEHESPITLLLKILSYY